MTNCCNDIKLEDQLEQLDVNLSKVDKWINGAQTEQVNLGGVNTDTIRKLVHDFGTAADGQLALAEAQADRAGDEADRSKDEADRAQSIADGLFLESGAYNLRAAFTLPAPVSSGSTITLPAEYYPTRNVLYLAYGGTVCAPSKTGLASNYQYDEVGTDPNTLSKQVKILFNAEAGVVFDMWVVTSALGRNLDAMQALLDETEEAKDEAAAIAEIVSRTELALTTLDVSAVDVPPGGTPTAAYDAATNALKFGLVRGATGATGPQGATGPKGDTGAAGITGTQGPQGPKGDTGATGATGPQGPKGDTGAPGASGSTGTAATVTVGTVTTGAAGTNAAVSNAGTASAAKFNFTIPRGATGATGATGAAGPQGPAGPKGDTGATGAAGPKGNTGATGATGAAGAVGAAGAAATIIVGTVTTGAAGTNAAVTNAGTAAAAKLNFTIPRGATGPQGPKGDTGPAGAARPSNSAGIGQWVSLSNGKLPAGGTWAYFILGGGYSDGYGSIDDFAVGVAAGGTTINISGSNYMGFAWRIA